MICFSKSHLQARGCCRMWCAAGWTPSWWCWRLRRAWRVRWRDPSLSACCLDLSASRSGWRSSGPVQTGALDTRNASVQVCMYWSMAAELKEKEMTWLIDWQIVLLRLCSVPNQKLRNYRLRNRNKRKLPILHNISRRLKQKNYFFLSGSCFFIVFTFYNLENGLLKNRLNILHDGIRCLQLWWEQLIPPPG